MLLVPSNLMRLPYQPTCNDNAGNRLGSVAFDNFSYNDDDDDDSSSYDPDDYSDSDYHPDDSDDGDYGSLGKKKRTSESSEKTIASSSKRIINDCR